MGVIVAFFENIALFSFFMKLTFLSLDFEEK
jgi:hypothetical protein